MQAQLAHQMTLAATSDNAINIAAACVVLAVCLALLALFVGALVSIVRSGLTRGMKLIWVVFAFVAPLIGSLLWFFIGRRDSQRRPRAA
ncbi:PLD nuclease N-terminal domain-containing protein [Streptomyces sp. NPDC050600]|uniref:PLD nuclease N-terminal domain-containing protein n=1 Tax=Streptomyces sp. NPDC050600 TaxID=3157213 RepID=UPI003432D89D